MNHDDNLTRELLDNAGRAPDDPAIVTAQASVGYRRLDNLVWRTAALLHEAGLRRGQVAGVAVVEPVMLAATLLAIARMGATCLPLARSTGDLECRDLALRCEARWLVTDRPSPPDIGLPMIRLSSTTLASAPRPSSLTLLMDERPKAPWQIVRSSGSTGEPRLLPIGHAHERFRTARLIDLYGSAAPDCHATFASLEFGSSRTRLLMGLLAGARFALLTTPGIDPVTLTDRLAVTHLGLSVFHAERILENGQGPEVGAARALRFVSITGSTVSASLRSRLREHIGDRLQVFYGANEVSHMTLAGAPEVYETDGTVGRPLPWVTIEIVDASGQPLPVDEAGEIRVTNPGGIQAYLGDDEATRRHFRDGWFHPGDLGRMTRDGQLIYCGRADHMMIMNGINIYPAEIERALASHPAVRDVAAVPFRSRTSQQIPVAAVALWPGQAVGAEELRAHALRRIGAHGPRKIVLLETIPRNEQGKLVRPALYQLMADRGIGTAGKSG